MDMDFRHRSNKRPQRNYLLFLLLFVWAIVVAFAGMQYFREKSFKIALLDSSLQQVNLIISEGLRTGNSIDDIFSRSRKHYPALRITVMDSLGNVTYDSSADVTQATNHSTRPEVMEAMKNRRGYTVRRLSESMRQDYFYSALRSDSLIIRSALPYNILLDKNLNVARTFLWLIIAVTAMVSIFVYVMFRRIIKTDEELQHERRRVLYEEQQNVRIKKQLTGSINHELKTPVSAISGCLETLIHNPDMEKEMRQDFIQQSYNHSQRLAKLLTDISIINRMDEAPDIIGREGMSLSKLIKVVVEERFYDPQAQPMPIRIENMDNTPLEMEGNAMLLRAVFRNLIDNATYYSGGTEIVIRFLSEEETSHGHFYHILFYDNGSGVSQEHLTHLFERFYRVDKGRSRKLGGTGLGLSIVKNAVLLHGGNIEVRNRAAGGLEFAISFKAESSSSANNNIKYILL